MNTILNKITLNLSLAISFGFPAAASAQVLISSEIQQVNSGLFRSNSEDFFQQGNRQLEQEITILLQKTVTSEGQILEIDEKLRSQICSQEFNISSPHSDTVSAAQIASFKAKLKEICRHN